MCPVPKGKDYLNRPVYSLGESLDEFDNCDYIAGKFQSVANDLCILQLNVRGIGSKQSSLQHLIDNCISDRTPDVVVLSETWLTPFSPTIKVPGYEFWHKDRTARRGGGVGLLISERIRHKIIQHKLAIGNTFEHLTAEICLRSNQKVLVSSIYRPPNTPEAEFIDEYSKFVCILKKMDNKGIIIGLDHNLDLLKTFKHGPTERFLNTNLSLNLIPTITRPTRITKNTATLIDNIFISQHWLSNYDSGVLIDDISDHLPSITTVKNLKVSKKEPITITSRDTRPKNVTALKTKLASINWQNLLTPNSPNTNMSLVHDRLAKEIDHFTPVKTHTVNPKKACREPWLTAGIYISIRKSKKAIFGDSSHWCECGYHNQIQQLQQTTATCQEIGKTIVLRRQVPNIQA